MKTKLFDEREKHVMGKIYESVFRTFDITLALIAACLYIVSLYSNIIFSMKQVAILLCIIAFAHRLTLKVSAINQDIPTR